MPKSTAKTVTKSASGVAQETLSFCTSCKMDLNHVIVAMKGDRIAKVQCLTCKKEHVYRAPKGITEPPPVDESGKPVRTRASKKKDTSGEIKTSSIEAEWEKLMVSHKDVPSKSYSMKGQFSLGDKIAHTTFGDGIVGKIIYPNKIEVIFRNELKVLIHGGTPQ